MLYRSLLLVFFVAVASFASVESVTEKPVEKSGYFQLGTDFNFGFNGGPTDPMFAVDTAEYYGKNWRGLRIPLETARNYEERIEPFFMLSFRAGYKNFHFLMEAPLRKDLEAWYNSELKTNFTYKPSELDINVPINAYAKWDNPVGFVQFGRFDPEDLKVSKNDIFLGGLPYHDGIHWKLNIGIFRYDFLLSSLNAWLFGDVMNHETGCPEDEKSEAYAQKCTLPSRQVSNQRNRTYTENVKNMVFHRLGVETSKFWLYLVEQSVIGGKSLEFRSFNPFMYWHDNYATGYTSAATSVEFGYKTSNGAKFYTQFNFEDVASPVGERKDMGTTRSIINYMVGYFHELETRKYGKFSWRLDVVRTDPVANNSKLPLLKYTGRRNYRSNFREQGDNDYADAYFVDYPIGYRRGVDALDLWFDMNWTWKAHSATLTLAWLRQGDKELYTDYNVALNADNSLSGVVEKQFLVDVLYQREVTDWFKFYVGGGFRVYRNLAHDKREDGSDAWIRSGLKFNFNPVDLKF